MNQRIRELAEQAGIKITPMVVDGVEYEYEDVEMDGSEDLQKFAELILQDMHRKVIASILITDVIMEEKGQKPTSEDYIQAINKDFGVES